MSIETVPPHRLTKHPGCQGQLTNASHCGQNSSHDTKILLRWAQPLTRTLLVSSPLHSWEYWHQRGNHEYASGDMLAAQRSHRIATLIRGEFGRPTRYLYKVARELGQTERANKIVRWVSITTNGGLKLTVLRSPMPDTATAGVEPTPAQPALSDRPAPAQAAPAEATDDAAECHAPAVRSRLGLRLGVTSLCLWAGYLYLAEAIGWCEAVVAAVGTTLPLVFGLGLAAAWTLDFGAAAWLRARGRSWSLAEAVMWRIPVNFDERQRPETGDKFAHRLIPHPIAGFVRRRMPTSPCIGPQGTSGRAFPQGSPSRGGPARILLVGGSVAEQLFSAERADFVSPLETAMHGDSTGPATPGAAAWCGAVFGWTAANFVPFAMAYGTRFNCIVALFGINELYSSPLASSVARTFYQSLAADDSDPNIRLIRSLEVRIREEINRLRHSPAVLFRGLGFLIRRDRLLGLLRERAALRNRKSSSDASMAGYIVDSLAGQPAASGVDECVRHILALQDYCDRSGIRLVNFLQPLAPYRKPLSEAERRALAGSGRRWEGYPQFVEQLMIRLGAHTEIHDLRAIFEGVEETIYADECHMVVDRRRFVGRGTEMLAAQIAAALKRPPGGSFAGPQPAATGSSHRSESTACRTATSTGEGSTT